MQPGDRLATVTVRMAGDTLADTIALRLLGVCREGGDRLYDEFGVETALKVLPNPVAETFELEYALAEEGAIAIELYDAAGHRACQLYAGDHAAGTYRLALATNGLASGHYIIVLKTPTRIIAGALTINR